ncbi:MAG: hypothetical protein ACLTUM_08325 [Christensenellales bacterium]
MKNIKKLLSLLLCGIMLFGMFPASLFAADGDTGNGSGTISETVVPKITWSRTFEYKYRHNDTEHQHTDLGGLHAGEKSGYFKTQSTSSSGVYQNKLEWSWATVSAALTAAETNNVWDYGTENQYADPTLDSIPFPYTANTYSPNPIGDVGIKPYTPDPTTTDSPIKAATWNNRTDKEYSVTEVDGIPLNSSQTIPEGSMDIGYRKSYTVRKFYGEFEWPEGYSLSDSIELVSKNDSYYKEIYDHVADDPDLTALYGGKKVFATNDDVYFFIYKASDKPKFDSDNYSDYLAFFSGTAGKGIWSWENDQPYSGSVFGNIGTNWNWGEEWQAKTPGLYGTQYALKAFHNCMPNTDIDDFNTRTEVSGKLKSVLSLSGGWYSFIDGNSLSTVLNKKYAESGINAGEKVCIEMFCFDIDKVGGMDELEIRLTRQKPTTSTVKVRYWLNEVGEITGNTNYLGETTMTGQTIGSQITLVNGTDVNQLDYLRAAAITANKNKDVNTGVQIEKPFTVTEISENNIINVVYIPSGQKIVELWAGELTVLYDGTEHVVHDVKITQSGYADISVSNSEGTTQARLGDGNTIKNITAVKKETLPGKYTVSFEGNSQVVNWWGTVLENYTIIYHPGSLAITYAPSAKVFTYDFGVQNSYSELLNDVEKSAAEIKVLDSSKTYVSYDKSTNALLYTPQSVNSGETIDLALVFAGGYQVKKSITFLPATNVLYEENFMTNSGTHGEWKAEGTNNTATVVKDNENSVYGYADAYKGFATFSNGGALKATLDLEGDKRAYTTDAVEFSFSGTGFDIISECGTDTGLLLVALSKGGNPFKVYIVDTYFSGDNGIGGNPPIITGDRILDYQVPVIRAMSLDHANYSVRILGYLTDTAGAIVGPANPTPWDGGETGAEGSTRGANGIDTNRILREAGLKEFIGCEVETSFMDENSVLNGGTGIAAKNSQNRTFGKRDTAAAQTANVYLDAFRVYQPLADETKYVENEQGLAYAPVYDYVKNSADLIPDEITDNSMVYVEYDGDTGIANIANYQKRGPQNEVYLTNGNYIGFALEGYTEGKTVMISAKAVAGEPILGYLNSTGMVSQGISYDMKMTEMYYDVTACVQQYGTKHMLVLGNIAEAGTRSILSVSGIKLANHIIPATSTQIAADIANLVTLAYQPVEEPVFTPERFELHYSGRALAGWFTSISVKTSTDVDHVSVYRLADDGSLVPVRENMRPMNSLFTYFGWMDYYAFSLTVRAPRRGMTDTYYIFAYDANGVASEPAIASITGR